MFISVAIAPASVQIMFDRIASNNVPCGFIVSLYMALRQHSTYTSPKCNVQITFGYAVQNPSTRPNVNAMLDDV